MVAASRTRRDEGFSVAEMMVCMVLLLVILGVVFVGAEALRAGADVTERQAQFSRDVATPLHAVDKAVSQNKALEHDPLNGLVCDQYRLTMRMPKKQGANFYTRHYFQARSDGRFTQEIVSYNLTGTVLSRRLIVWSRTNANVAKGRPAFVYRAPNAAGTSEETTVPPGARSLIVELWSTKDGVDYSATRRVFFRNR